MGDRSVSGEGTQTLAAALGAELAICTRAVGIADRPDLAVLELTGRPGAVADVVGRVVGARLEPDRAAFDGAWWCPVADRVLAVVGQGEREALSARIRAAARTAPGVSCHDASRAYAAISVVGPRARQLLRVVTLDGDVADSDGWCGGGIVAGAPAVVLRESLTQYLLLMVSRDEEAERRALLDAGAALGAGRVGPDAVGRYAVVARPLSRRRPASRRSAASSPWR